MSSTPFPSVVCKFMLFRDKKAGEPFCEGEPFPKQQILDSSKLKEFADNNFKFDENDKVLQTDRKHCGKRINHSL